MSSDNTIKPADAKWRHAGPGMSQQFRCARCDLPRPMLGRRQQPVRGMRQWVCVGCVR